ncbi:MAG: ion transporter [Ignavibacteriales bacterium]|nr:ion transporter [Ignavibacteriales bacterium]
MNKKWSIYQTNFDNIFSAMLTVFILSTQENWPNIMYRAVDSNTSDIVITIKYIFFLKKI